MYTLTLLLLLPLVGVAIIALLSRFEYRLIRAVAVGASSLTLLLAWSLLGSFDPTLDTLQFSITVPWNPRLGTSYALGLDGFSYPMVLLATLLSLVAILASGAIHWWPSSPPAPSMSAARATTSSCSCSSACSTSAPTPVISPTTVPWCG